ncbi:MAG: DMT family transporter [Candidatus Eisenbacteria bacterium]|uniref:DMT family transporter n=1 Tax=Eiseniibacteriota bacterium TaxID=2212470 RepID=A0A7Y2E7N0_UNCEI|nr:DMT family transporter [Candidatus Eisenbacteria bacterium]
MSRPTSHNENPSLGYLFAVATAAISAVSFVAAKPVLAYLDPLSFAMSQFGIAAVFSFVWLLAKGEHSNVKRLTARQWTFLTVVALLFLASVYTLCIGLSRIPATAASLLNRLEVLVTVFFGVALLGDRFSRRETWGGVVAILGVIILRYDAPSSFSSGFWMMVLSATLFGFTEVLVKTQVHNIPPRTFAFMRNIMVFGLFVVAGLWRVAMQDGQEWSGIADWSGIQRGWAEITVAAFAGPMLARTTQFYSLRHIDVSHASLILQTQPVFVAIMSALILHALPSRREWVGGIFIILGCFLLVHWQRAVRRQTAGHPSGES